MVIQNYTFEDFSDAINNVFLMISTMLIFMMHLGFAFLEGGNIRMKNIQSLQFQKCLTICYTTIAWWVCGFAFAYGQDHSGFIGASNFFATSMTNHQYTLWMFQWGFAGTATTIVSGCIVERMPVIGYTIYNLFQVAWIYPVVVHWVWGNGWLAQLGYKDFAGCSVVHLVAGLQGTLATYMIGTFSHQYLKDPEMDDLIQINNRNLGQTILYLFKSYLKAYGMLGALMLWFSFFAFNIGSLKNAIDQPYLISLIGLNTAMSASLGGIASTFLYYVINNRKYSQQNLCNGFLCGLVIITGSAGYIEAWAACVIGIESAIIYQLMSSLLWHFQIDDPIDAGAVHLGCGFIGIIDVAFFDVNDGLFYGGDGSTLGKQLLGLLAITVWVTSHSIILLIILRQFGILRESKEIEESGLDQAYFGGSPYNYDLLTLRLLARLQRLEQKQKLERLKKQEQSIELIFDDQVYYSKNECQAQLQSIIN